MIPADIRNLTWEEVRELVNGPREMIHDWLRAYGPATTTAIAAGTGIPLLTVRPRVTELCQLGFAECVGRERREGVYRAVPPMVAAQRHEEAVREAQMELGITTTGPAGHA